MCLQGKKQQDVRGRNGPLLAALFPAWLCMTFNQKAAPRRNGPLHGVEPARSFSLANSAHAEIIRHRGRRYCRRSVLPFQGAAFGAGLWRRRYERLAYWIADDLYFTVCPRPPSDVKHQVAKVGSLSADPRRQKR